MDKGQKSVAWEYVAVIPGMWALVYLFKIILGLNPSMRTYYIWNEFNRDLAFCLILTSLSIGLFLAVRFYASKKGGGITTQ